MTKILIRLLVLSASLVMGLLFIELAMRVVYSRRLDYQIEMSRYASTIKRPSADPRLTHEHTPNSHARLMGVPVAINSLGFRDRELSVGKPAGTARVVLIGDSLTFGWGVPVENRFSESLSDQLNQELSGVTRRKVEVINTGIGNYNTVQEVALFEGAGRRLKPDVVVLNWFINDAEPTPTRRSPYIISYSYLAMWMWGRLDTLDRMGNAAKSYREYYADLYDDRQPGFIAMGQAFARLGEIGHQDGFTLVVALLPELHTVWPHYEFQSIHDKVGALAIAGGAGSVADLAPAFAGERPEGLWVSPDDAHPNSRGHAIIGKVLFEHFKAAGLMAGLAKN